MRARRRPKAGWCNGARLDGEALSSMKGIRRKLRRKAYQTAAIIAAIFIVFCVLLYYFPVYRVLEVGHVKFGDYYTGEEIAMALYIGSAPDRRQAQSVLRLADRGFQRRPAYPGRE